MTTPDYPLADLVKPATKTASVNPFLIVLSLIAGVIAGVLASDFNFETKNLKIDEQQAKINQLTQQQDQKDNWTQKFCNTYFKEEQ